MKPRIWILALFLALLAACAQEAPVAEEAPPGDPTASASSHDPVEVEATEMDVIALAKRLDAGEDVFLLDVRNPDELVEHGAIEGYVNIPIDQLEERLAEVPKDKPIVSYCMRGGRASRAAKTLRDAGYDQPIEYGGITAWKAAGQPVVEPKTE